MNTKVITAGEKLKDIRKRYNIKQYELSGNQLTRNMISMIETDKACLTKSTAKTLLQNMYKLCSERFMECDVTLEYLLESAEYQAKKIFNDFIHLLNSNPEKVFENDFQKNVDEIIKLLNKYKLKKEKFSLYLKSGEIFGKFCDFFNAYLYYLRAFESTAELLNDPQLIDLIINLTYYCNKLEKYKETLHFSKLVYIYVNDIPKDKDYKIKFNSIIACKNLKDYNSALKVIEEIEITFKDKLNSEPTKKINIMILKANCLNERSFYMDSLQIHKIILTLTEDNIELHLVTLCNIIEIYITMNDSKNLKKYIDKCIFNLKKYKQLDNKKFSSEIYKDIGLGYYTINKFEMSKLYLNKALKESKEYKKVNLMIPIIEKLLYITINNNCADEVYDLKNKLLEIISLNLLPTNNSLIFQFIKYFNDLGDTETVNDIATFASTTFDKFNQT